MSHNVINIDTFRRNRENTHTVPLANTFLEGMSEGVVADINKLCEALGIDEIVALEIASDFYKKYPELMEHVRHMREDSMKPEVRKMTATVKRNLTSQEGLCPNTMSDTWLHEELSQPIIERENIRIENPEPQGK